MRTSRSFSLLAVLILFLTAFTACRKGQRISQVQESETATAEPRPTVLAKDQAAPLADPQKVDTPNLPWLNSAAAEPRPPVLAANNAVPSELQKMDTPDLNPLNLEVAALETLGQLKLTRSQLERLAKLAPATAHKAPPSRPIKVSAEYQKTLKDLRAALIDEDEERIADLTLTLDELREKEDPDFDEVEITAAARRHTAEVLRGLSAGQVVSFLTDFADEFPDPYEKVTDAFEDVRKLPDEDWEELRDEVAGQVGWLAAGLDSAAEAKVRERVKELLNRVHRLKEEEYMGKRAELEKAAKSILGNVEPTEVIRHFTERSLAELLSNPRLSAALEARLKKME